jgi:hypothetical protein
MRLRPLSSCMKDTQDLDYIVSDSEDHHVVVSHNDLSCACNPPLLIKRGLLCRTCRGRLEFQV